MSNHLHVAAVAGKQPLSSWIRRVHSPFADFMNKSHDRIGPLFVRGPRALETPASDVARLVSYVHNNPVRAKVAETASDSTWTSHRAYLGLDRPPSWLDVDLGLQLCGFDDPQTFDQFVRLHPSDPARETLERGAIELDQSALFREAVASGGGHDHERPSARVIVEATAMELGVTIASICSPCKIERLTLAREVAVRAASMVGITGAAIAEALGVSQSGASRALQRAASRPNVIELSASVVQRVLECAAHGTHA